MASAHIEVSATATRMSSELRYFVTLLQQVQDQSDKLSAAYSQFAADYAALAAALSLSAADAEAVATLIGSVEGALNDAFIAQFLSRCG